MITQGAARLPLRAAVTVLILALCAPLSGLGEVQRGHKQFDYYATDAHSKRRVKVVEQYHWSPALRCMDENRYQCAEGELQFILNWVPNHPRALLKYSELMTELDQPERAKLYFDAATQFAPNDPTVRMAHGIHLHRSGDTGGAIEKYREAISLDPSLSEAHYNLGLAFIAKGDLTSANEHAQKAYALGYPLPGLRSQLKSKGAWKPLTDTTEASAQ